MAGAVDVVHGRSERPAPTEHDVVVQDVYRRYRDRVIGFFVHRTHDRALAEDLTHDTFVRFAGALDQFDPERRVWPYLKVIATHVLIDHNRREGRQVVMDVEEDLVDQTLDGEDLDDTVVLRNLLDRAIGDLSERQRVAVELRCARGWNVAESAEFLGIDRRAFRQLLFRARRNLRAALEESGARLGGVIAPVLVWLRVRMRSASVRVREFGQNPSAAVSLDGLASVMVAATLGVAAGVGAPSWADEADRVSPTLELVRQDVATSAAPEPATEHELPVETAPPPPAEPPAAPTGGETSASVEHDEDGTVIEASNTVPNSKARVTAGDDGERFVVTDEGEVEVGPWKSEWSGDTVSVDCDNLIGEVLCGSDDLLSGD